MSVNPSCGSGLPSSVALLLGEEMLEEVIQIVYSSFIRIQKVCSEWVESRNEKTKVEPPGWLGPEGAHRVLTFLGCPGLQGFLVPEYLPDSKQSLRLGGYPVPEVVGVSDLRKQL